VGVFVRVHPFAEPCLGVAAAHAVHIRRRVDADRERAAGLLVIGDEPSLELGRRDTDDDGSVQSIERVEQDLPPPRRVVLVDEHDVQVWGDAPIRPGYELAQRRPVQ
jgi:hypothetical protein